MMRTSSMATFLVLILGGFVHAQVARPMPIGPPAPAPGVVTPPETVVPAKPKMATRPSGELHIFNERVKNRWIDNGGWHWKNESGTWWRFELVDPRNPACGTCWRLHRVPRGFANTLNPIFVERRVWR